MCITESSDVGPYDLMSTIIEDGNIDDAAKQVIGNRGAPGIDGMKVDELLPRIKLNREILKDELMTGRYKPTPVRRVEIPKDTEG